MAFCSAIVRISFYECWQMSAWNLLVQIIVDSIAVKSDCFKFCIDKTDTDTSPPTRRPVKNIITSFTDVVIVYVQLRFLEHQRNTFQWVSNPDLQCKSEVAYSNTSQPGCYKHYINVPQVKARNKKWELYNSVIFHFLSLVEPLIQSTEWLWCFIKFDY